MARFIQHSFNEYVLNICYVLGIFLGTGAVTMNGTKCFLSERLLPWWRRQWSNTHIYTHTHTHNVRVYSASSVVPGPVDCSPLGSSVEWVAISSFKTQLPMQSLKRHFQAPWFHCGRWNTLSRRETWSHLTSLRITQLWQRNLTLVGEGGGEEGQSHGNELEDCYNNPGEGTFLGSSG